MSSVSLTGIGLTEDELVHEGIDDCPEIPWDPGGSHTEEAQNNGADEIFSNAVHSHVDIARVKSQPSGKTRVYIVTRGENERGSTVILGFTSKDFRDAHFSYSDTRVLVNWFESGEEPKQGEFSLSCPATKYYWINRERFCMIKGVVLESSDQEQKRLLVPSL